MGPKTAQRIDYSNLESVGEVIEFKLDTSPILLDEAAAFVDFVCQTVALVLGRVEEDANRPFGLVPVVDIQPGSVNIKITFQSDKGNLATAAAAAATMAIVTKVVNAIFAVLIATSSMPMHSTYVPPPPHTVLVDTLRPQVSREIYRLTQVLEASGKPFRLEIGKGVILVEGNQPADQQGDQTEQPQPPSSRSRSYRM